MAEGPGSSASTSSTASDFTFLYSPEVGKTVEVPEEQEASKIGRKRVRNTDNWSVKHVKKPGLRKNSPRLQLTDITDCCKKRCIQGFSSSHLSKIRSDFEGLYYEQQNIHLSGVFKRRQTKKTSGHARKKSPTLSSKGKRYGRPPAEESKFTFEYSLRNEDGVDVKVCQSAFCSVYGFGPKRLLVLRRKLDPSGITIEPDKRGKHDNHPTVGEEVKDLIREHIRSFPARHSHYSRRDNAGFIYLLSSLYLVFTKIFYSVMTQNTFRGGKPKAKDSS